MEQTEKDKDIVQEAGASEAAAEQAAAEQAAAPEAEEAAQQQEAEQLKAALAEQESKYLRLLAEYDNYRKRSQREKSTTWADAQAEAVLALLPVYDNLERALKQETCDEAYAKGVEMTMNQLKTILEKLGIEEIPTVGQTFDPLLHNAIFHVEDEGLGKNVIAECFQTGFKLGGKVVRVAMVKVAN